MKTPCAEVRQRILAKSDPRHPGPRSRDHIEGCAACREWFAGVVRLETALSAIRTVPVPVSRGPNVFVGAFLEGKATMSGRATPSATAPSLAPAMPARSPVAEGRQQWLLWLGGVAASLVLLSGIVRILGPGKDTGGLVQAPPDPFMQRMVELNIEIASAESAAVRVERLADMADELDQQMRTIVLVERDPKNLQSIADMYGKVVSEGVMAQLDDLRGPANEVVLDRLAARLNRANLGEEELSANVPPAAKEPLREMAAVSKKGTSKLRQILSGRDL